MSIILKSKIVLTKLYFTLTIFGILVYGCVLSYLTIRSTYYIGHINCSKKSNDKTLLLFNIKSHLGHKSIAEASICVQV